MVTTDQFTHELRSLQVTGCTDIELAAAITLAFSPRDVVAFKQNDMGFWCTDSQKILAERSGPDPDWKPLMDGDGHAVASYARAWLDRLSDESRIIMCRHEFKEAGLMPDVAEVQGWRARARRFSDDPVARYLEIQTSRYL
jgi:hypothetical protein